MEQQLYERPRERIRAKGAQSLSTAELLQVIIGSGSKNHSVASLAKKVSEVLPINKQADLYEALCAIPGIGDASACRILAALQLQIVTKTEHNHALQHVDILKFATHKHLKVHGLTLDNKHNILNTYNWSVRERKATGVISKQLFSKAIVDDAHSLIVIIGCLRQSLKAGVFELSILNDLKELANITQVKLKAVVLANKTKVVYLHGESNEPKLS